MKRSQTQAPVRSSSDADFFTVTARHILTLPAPEQEAELKSMGPRQAAATRCEMEKLQRTA